LELIVLTALFMRHLYGTHATHTAQQWATSGSQSLSPLDGSSSSGSKLLLKPDVVARGVRRRGLDRA